MLEKDATMCMYSEAGDAAELNKEESNHMEKEIKVLDESSRPLLFCEKIKGLSPHRCPLKDRMKDKRFRTLICFDRIHFHKKRWR